MGQSKRTASEGLGKDGMALAAVFVTSGVMHCVRPEVFQAMVPNSIPARRLLVYVSGAAEIACGLGLLNRATRRVAGLASAVLLVAIFPANVTMAGQARRRFDRDRRNALRRGYLAATVVRLPLQWPMIRTALRAAGVRR
ncbi:MAG: MauE/DoxX family redox-associated membrane protein [Terracoccus sp.]